MSCSLTSLVSPTPETARARAFEKLERPSIQRLSRQCRFGRESSDCLLVRAVFRPSCAFWLVLELMCAQLLAVAVRAAALKVPHQRRIDAGRVKPKCLQSALEQISRCFVSAGKNAKISRRNSEILRHARQFRRIATGEFIDCRSFCPKGFPDFSTQAH